MNRATIQKTARGWTILLMLLLCSCRDDAQIRSLGDQIRGLEVIQAEAKGEMERLQLQMKAVQAERDKLKSERDKLQSQMDEAAKQLEAIRKEFTEYKAQYKVSIRKRAPGMELEVVELEGRKFERVRVRELTDSNLTFMHQAGTMSVPLSRLSPSLQTRLGYEKAVPVMAVTKEAVSIPEEVGLDLQMEEMDYEVARLRRQLADMRKAFAEENGNVNRALTVTKTDPTLHRHAAAALQARISQADVELAELLKKKVILEEKARAKKKQ